MMSCINNTALTVLYLGRGERRWRPPRSPKYLLSRCKPKGGRARFFHLARKRTFVRVFLLVNATQKVSCRFRHHHYRARARPSIGRAEEGIKENKALCVSDRATRADASGIQMSTGCLTDPPAEDDRATSVADSRGDSSFRALGTFFPAGAYIRRYFP